MERLGYGRAAVSELMQPFDMALPSFLQNLNVLEKSGLVRSHKDGRVRTYEVVPERFGLVEDWMAAQRRLWENRFSRLDDYLAELQGHAPPRQPRDEPAQSTRPRATKRKRKG